MAVILVVDDEIGIRELLNEILSDEGYTVELAENASVARLAMLKRHPDLVLLDIWMPDNDGISLLKEWRSRGSLTFPVIMMSGHATLDTAIEATKFGAVDFLEKPIAMSRLLSSVKSALEKVSPELKIGTAHSTLPPVTPTGFTPVTPAPRIIEHKADNLTSMLSSVDFDAPLREARDQFERIYFTYLLKKENNSMTKVASAAGLERTHLYRKLKQLGLEVGKAGRASDRPDFLHSDF